MKRVTGIGGIFFKCENPKQLLEWYNKHLGIKQEGESGIFEWKEIDKPDSIAQTVFGVFPKDTSYFKPGEKQFMFNYRVENLEELLKQLKEEGIEQVGEIEEYSYGKFGWIMDPEGNKIELWEPNDASS
jgi:predicted enzyme related to lactoylglutathione lyase